MSAIRYTSPAATSKDEAMAVMEEEDLDAVAEAWGGEDEDLIPGAPTEGLDEEMEGFEEAGANGEEDEEGGWDMEVSCHFCIQIAFAHSPLTKRDACPVALTCV